jgi:RNA polymerase sigma-70 factor (ECF subfamily)
VDAALALSDFFFQKGTTERLATRAQPREEPLSASLSDPVLVARARKGEIAAFEMLMERHRERVLNLAFQLLRDRDEAEDIAQDAFANAFAALKNFRGEAQFSTWLYRITFNLCVHRKRKIKPTEEFQENIHGGRGEDTALTKMMVEETLAQLSPPLRAALVLREMHDLSYEEIAAVLEIPVGTVRSRLNEARRQFRALWMERET